MQNKEDYVKFLILDYNSNDGLEEYIQSAFSAALQSGKLVYYRNPEPAHFNQSHSRNMAFRLADADLVCNVDADNFVGPGFGKYLCAQFRSANNIYFTGIGNALNVEDVRGKVCVKKHDFLHINGYDESFEGYGYEDYDFVNRLDMNGLKRQKIEEASFLLALTHPNAQRLSNEKLRNALDSIYVHYLDPDSSKILLLMKDGTAFLGTVINNYSSRNTDYPYASAEAYEFDFKFLMQGGWSTYIWEKKAENLIISEGTTSKLLKPQAIDGQEMLQSDEGTFYKVTKPEMIGEGVMFFMLIRNRERMRENSERKHIILNRPFGQGTVYKNFNYQDPVKL